MTAIPVGLVIGFGLTMLALQPEFFWQDDFQTQYLPASKEIAQALSAGEWPILSRHCWFGAGLAGEYQHGVFSVVTLAANWLVWQLDLSLPNLAAVLTLFHLSLLAAGAFRLARARALTVDEATLVALIAALNGWLINWGKSWYPAITSFTWLPWAWWALERALATPNARDSVLAGFFLYLMLAAGWPIGVLMIASLTVCLALRAMLARRSPLACWPACAAWLIALGLSAPSLLMFLEYGQLSNRVAEKFALDRQWMMPPSALLGMILPAAASWWRGYSAVWHPKPSLELSGGLVPAVAVLYAVLWRGSRALRASLFDVGVAGLALLMAMIPCVRPFQSSFRWLPLAHLALALVGASCLRELRCQPPSPWSERAGVRLAALAAASVATVAVLADAEDMLGTAPTLRMACVLIAGALAWAALAHFYAHRLQHWPAVAFCLFSLFATYFYLPPLPDAPRWPMTEAIRRPEPYDRSVRYLSMFDDNELFYWSEDAQGKPVWKGGVTELRPGYSAMYAGLDFINGFSAMMPFGPCEILLFHFHSETQDPSAAKRMLLAEAGPGGLVDLMGANGLVLSDLMAPIKYELKPKGWRVAAQVPGGLVMHQTRPNLRVRSLLAAETVVTKEQLLQRLRAHEEGPAPIVLLGARARRETFVQAELSKLHDRRLESTVQVVVPASGPPALVLFARPWVPGWQAELNGQPLEVEQMDALMPAVRVPAGARGTLTLRYRPRSLERGLWIALLAAVVSGGWLVIAHRRTAR